MHYKEVKAILSPQNGMNLYRGCTHGCIYCDSRSKCYRMDHEFEDIEVKAKAAELLENTLRKKRRKGMISTGSMTDPYVPIEEELLVTRRCLNQIERFDFGLVIQTKSKLILRDIDILEKINRKTKCIVAMTLTTYDEELCKILEPNVCTTKERFEVLMEMKKRNIPTIVWLDPILPFINDTEENMRGIMDYCVQAGVYGIMYFGAGMTLREGNREYFYEQLDRYFPGMKERYIETFGNGYEVNSPNDDSLTAVFNEICDANNIVRDREELLRYMREYKNKTMGDQMSIFDFEMEA
ncbi:MAG: radical SAM protein [Clostridium sp.]|nr:radical SAM protein [Clostridium sp.]MCM1398527.1 radical SAM protein [Clostridium sp.]MCM1460249.1 radical SAM protein [Bacteroides sp.]